MPAATPSPRPSSELDRFEVRVGPLVADGGTRGRSLELLLNGRGLLDLVREAELPHAYAEYDADGQAGEPLERLGTRGALAGDYDYPDASHVFLPSRNLLGAPYKHSFDTEADDRRNQQSLALWCTCGEPECWFLLVTITVNESTVEWADFRQFHRDWRYDLGPFVFDRSSYEAQLVRP